MPGVVGQEAKKPQQPQPLEQERIQEVEKSQSPNTSEQEHKYLPWEQLLEGSDGPPHRIMTLSQTGMTIRTPE